MFSKYLLLILSVSLTLPVNAQTNKPIISTSDVENFWKAYDLIQEENDRVQHLKILQSTYFDNASEGLNVFMRLRNFDAVSLLNTLHKYPKFWDSIKPNTQAIKQKIPLLDTYLARFQALYPNYREATIYFTITAVRAGGTTEDSMVLIGSEIACGNQNTDVSEFPDKRLATFFQNHTTDNIIPFTVHEYVHTQQKSTNVDLLLSQAIMEGACDFITELVLEEPLNHSYLTYGRLHETRLKEEFKEVMFTNDFSNWLYNGSTTSSVGDLGYFMGYVICKSYYDHSADKKNAIQEIIDLDYADDKEVKRFLDKSQYYEKKQ